VQTADGRYALDTAHALVTFTPARGFAGQAAGVRYRVHGDEATEATGTYTPEVTPPAAPAATALATSGAAGALQRIVVPAAAGTTVALLDVGGAPATSVSAPGEGRYDLADGTITFRPAAGVAGRGHGVRFRLTDEYGQTAEAAYVPTVIAPPVTAPPRVRLTTAPLVVASPEGEVTLGCGVTAGTLATCRITLVAEAAGRRVTVGTGSASGDGRADVLVTVRLTVLGRDLSRQPGGVAVRAEARVTVGGRVGSLTGATGIHAVARSFVLRHAVRFGRGAATLRAGERRYLDALAGALAGARRVTCIGAARDVRGLRRARLARARAAATCAFLRARLPRATALTSRAERPAERRGGAARVDLVLRY
jgi:CshA-type fibril repeat protein